MPERRRAHTPARPKVARANPPPPARVTRDVLAVDVVGDAIVVTIPPKGGSATAEQQAKALTTAAGVLAEAMKIAPDAKIHIRRRDHVIASTDESRVVAVLPSRSHSGPVFVPAPVDAAPAVAPHGKPVKPGKPG